MFENLIALNTGVGFAVWGGGYGEALRCEIRENTHTGVDVSCLGVVKERNIDITIFSAVEEPMKMEETKLTTKSTKASSCRSCWRRDNTTR